MHDACRLAKAKAKVIPADLIFGASNPPCKLACHMCEHMHTRASYHIRIVESRVPRSIPDTFRSRIFQVATH